MYFILSKILAFISYPTIWVILLLLFGVFSKKEKRRKKLIWSGIICFWVFSNGLIFQSVMSIWEDEGIKYSDVTTTYDVAIVLGGMSELNLELNRISFRRGADRIWQTVALYKRNKVKKILISGGTGKLIDDGMREGTQLKEFLIKLGIPEIDIIEESISKNTYQNAIESKRVIDQLNLTNGSILLVTSGYHIPRAKACFDKINLNVDVFSTDHFTGNPSYSIEQILIPSPDVMGAWRALIHEWIGCITYSLVGYI